MKSSTKKIVLSALLASLVCVATMIIKIPSPLNGYLNLGDCIVLLCGWLLSPLYGFLASGLGSALADILSGYAIYAPATFIIKGLMALTAYYGYNFFKKNLNSLTSRIVCAVLAEIIMILGYFVFEGFMYGFIPSAVNIPANAVQGIAGVIVGTVLVKIFEKNKFVKF